MYVSNFTYKLLSNIHKTLVYIIYIVSLHDKIWK